MLKRSLYFGNPAYLTKQNQQLLINLPNVQKPREKGALRKNPFFPQKPQETEKPTAEGENALITNPITIPIEDIAYIILDNPQITISQGLINALLDNNVALITCNEIHHPTGLLLNLCGHTHQALRFKHQIAATQTLKKQLWQQTIKAKIYNQAQVLQHIAPNQKINNEPLLKFANEVKSGDAGNLEARAAAYYWKNIFSDLPNLKNFRREREGLPPNNLLNYGYAILRAVVARSLVGSGLLPTFGIFHRNQYNHYCLADDIMEAYRPYVDKLVYEIIAKTNDYEEISKAMKTVLLSIPTIDVSIIGEISPLMIGVTRTTASLAQCFEGKARKILYPEM